MNSKIKRCYYPDKHDKFWNTVVSGSIVGYSSTITRSLLIFEILKRFNNI